MGLKLRHEQTFGEVSQRIVVLGCLFYRYHTGQYPSQSSMRLALNGLREEWAEEIISNCMDFHYADLDWRAKIKNPPHIVLQGLLKDWHEIVKLDMRLLKGSEDPTLKEMAELIAQEMEEFDED